MLVEYTANLSEVLDLASCVHEEIRSHITQDKQIKDIDALHLSIQPQFYASSYMQIQAYGNHFKMWRYPYKHPNGHI